MKNVKVCVDVWDGPRNVGESTANASESDVLSALESLDGKKRDSMLIEIDEHHYLAVGGGAEDRFVLSIVDGSKTHDLLGDEANNGEQLIKVGGQQVPSSRSLLVSGDIVRIAVSEYLSSGGPSENLKWRVERF